LEAFPKIQGETFKFFDYGEYLLRFAVSLAWRVLVSDRDGVLVHAPQWKAKIDLTLENWRRYLLGLQTPTGIVHLFIVPGIPSSAPSNAHPKSLHYLLRAVDATVVSGTQNLAVYVKLLRSIFYAPIVPSNPKGWKDTRIHSGPARLVSGRQELSMSEFWPFVESRIRIGFDKPSSARALAQITKSFKKDAQRVLGSESYEVHTATKHMWGTDE
jgi:hypothetical protein